MGEGVLGVNTLCFVIVCVCVCVCVGVGWGGGGGYANQPEYHHLANIRRAEEIKTLKVTEQFRHDNYATINWTDKGADISESYNRVLDSSLSEFVEIVLKVGFRKNKQ